VTAQFAGLPSASDVIGEVIVAGKAASCRPRGSIHALPGGSRRA